MRVPCIESSLWQLWLLLDPYDCDRKCSEQLEERHCLFISTPTPVLCLWSPSPLLRLFLFVLFCPSGTLFLFHCHCRCACVLESQIKLLFLFRSRRSFQVSASIPRCPHCYLLHNAISSEGRNCIPLKWLQHIICVCMCGLVSVCVCVLHFAFNLLILSERVWYWIFVVDKIINIWDLFKYLRTMIFTFKH